MMFKIGCDMHQQTGAFSIENACNEPPRVFNVCMAPGGFLASVLHVNPNARAFAFSLPVADGGHKVLLPDNANVKVEFLDVTMLAADMGSNCIPKEHPDAGNFLRKKIMDDQSFDLVICDGQVLRMHARAAYREAHEARRLTVTQLALGLEHVKQGGTIVVLLHKAEAPDTVSLLYTFSRFSSVSLYKHRGFHAKRSSFYLIASNIQRQDHEVELAIKSWKESWRMSTLGTDEEYDLSCYMGMKDAKDMLEAFGSELYNLGRDVWRVQLRALKKASFTTKKE